MCMLKEIRSNCYTPLTNFSVRAGSFYYDLKLQRTVVKSVHKFFLVNPNFYTAAAAKSLQSCPTLCNPIDGSPEKAMAPHSSTPAWKIPWTEKPGRLQSMGLRRVAHD